MMNIELHEITIREVTNGFKDSAENGVVGFDGKLNIRPAFQREFVYNEKQEHAVIDASQQVGWKIAEGRIGPVHILQDALRVIGRADSQVLLHFLIP